MYIWMGVCVSIGEVYMNLHGRGSIVKSQGLLNKPERSADFNR